jgi:predicted glycoside hydrolase/deacetylase ChbG (UPF0249 family)
MARLMARTRRFCTVLLALSAIAAFTPKLSAQTTGVPEVVLRLDDVGMNHSVNNAIAKVAETGMPFSVSVMFACPWYQEAVEILRKNPQIAVGVHLTLNSEWRNYRWGPVLGKAGVPSLVDSVGYFVPSSEEFLARKYDLGEVEKELTAQMDRAVASGLKIAYVDHHMGTAAATPELRTVLERVAKKYGVGISRYFGESYHTMFDTPIESKKSAFLTYLSSINGSRTNLIVVHAAERSPEMEVLFDRNNAAQNSAGGLPLVARHRQSELEMVLSPEFAQLVRSGKVRLITYEQLVARVGTAAMRRPIAE